MMRKMMMIGAAAAACAVAAPVAAQSIDDDVRCLLAANVFARTDKDPAKRQVAAATSVFYLGRLDARISTEQLKAAVTAQVKTMPASTLTPTMNACFKRLAAKGGAMHDFSARGVAPNPSVPKKK